MNKDTNILTDIKEKLLSIYQPHFWFINTIVPEFPKTTGTFVIPQRQYTINDSPGLSGACSTILITQAILISLAEHLYYKKIPQLSHLDYDNLDKLMEFWKNTVVCKYKNVKFNKFIFKEDPDDSFELELIKINYRSEKGLIFFAVDYSVSSGKHCGSWIIAYNKHKFPVIS